MNKFGVLDSDSWRGPSIFAVRKDLLQSLFSRFNYYDARNSVSILLPTFELPTKNGLDKFQNSKAIFTQYIEVFFQWMIIVENRDVIAVQTDPDFLALGEVKLSDLFVIPNGVIDRKDKAAVRL